MHPAWHIDDIRLLILKHLSPQDLAILSQSSQNLFDLTIPTLWKTIHTPAALISPLPALYRDRPLRPSDLTRLDFYASKIQHICFQSPEINKFIRLPAPFTLKRELFKGHNLKRERVLNDARKSWEDLWSEIAALRPASEFLPSLRTLRFNNGVEELFHPFVGIAGSNLSQIYVKYLHHRQEPSVLHTFLTSLGPTPNLTYIFVRDGEPDLLPTKLIEQAPLKHLRLDPRVHTTCRHGTNLKFKAFPLRDVILRKESLEELTLGLTREWHSPGAVSSLPPSLPNLKRLHLHLTTFFPQPCEALCANAGPDSWTCTGLPPNTTTTSNPTRSCDRQPPEKFFSLVARPALTHLYIKFPVETTGNMYLSLLSSIQANCNLSRLEELNIAPSSNYNNCPECGSRALSKILPGHLHRGLQLLFPLPSLRVLKLQVAPNFLGTFDMDLYRSLTAQLQNLETLWLGHAYHITCSEFTGTTFHDHTSLKNLAAFCSLLPKLEEVSVGTINCEELEWEPNAGEWVSDGVKRLDVKHWAGPNRAGSVDWNTLMRSLRAYFPNSDLAEEGPHRRGWIFEGT